MNVYLFSIDKEKVDIHSCGMVIVAADTADEAWDALKKELPDYDAEYFSRDICEQVHSLTSLLTEAAVITYNCYYE